MRLEAPEQLLTQLPMLMAHDAATCYAGYSAGQMSGYKCYQWKTQAFDSRAPFMGRAGHMPSGFTSLLDCGTRALDLRLTKDGPCTILGLGVVCMHHAGLQIEDQTFESELLTIVQWAARNPTELVLLKLRPDNADAPAAIQAALDTYNITSLPRCSVRGGVDWTVEQARRRARLPNGGMILATWAPALPNGQPADESCVDDNFVPSMGYDPADANSSFGALWMYADEVVKRQGRSRKFQELQLMWQSTQTFHNYMRAYPLHALDRQPFKYGNLRSTQESLINARVLDRIGDLRGPALNLVKLNDVCFHGPEIARRLGTNVTREHEASCAAMCGGFNPQHSCLDQQLWEPFVVDNLVMALAAAAIIGFIVATAKAVRKLLFRRRSIIRALFTRRSSKSLATQDAAKHVNALSLFSLGETRYSTGVTRPGGGVIFPPPRRNACAGIYHACRCPDPQSPIITAPPYPLV